MAELALDDAERMLGRCPHHGDDAVDTFVEGMQLATLGGGSGQNMGVIFVVAARAKVSSLRGGGCHGR